MRNFGEQRTVFLRMNELAVDLRRSIFPVGKKGSFLRSSRLRFHFPVLLQYLFCNLRKRHALQTAFIQKLHVDRRCNPVLLSADDKRLFFDTVQLLHRFYLHLKIIAGFSFQQRGKLLFEHLIVHFFPPFLFDCLLYFCFTEQKKLRKTQLKNLCTDLYMPEIRWFAELRTMRKTGPDCFRQPLSAIFQTNILFI